MNLFFNLTQSRLRFLWRLALFLLVGAGILFGLLVLVGIAMVVVWIAQGHPIAAIGDMGANWFKNEPGALSSIPWQLIIGGFGLLLPMSLALWFAARWLDRRPIADYGFHLGKAWWRDLCFGFLVGAILMAAIFLFELIAGFLTISQIGPPEAAGAGWGVAMGLAFVAFIIVALGEELLFRGYLLRNLAESLHGSRIKPALAILIAAVLSSVGFGLMHMGNDHSSLISTVNLIVAGLFISLCYLLSGELAIPLGYHLSWNFFQGNVFGFPVSGTQAGPSLIRIRQSGPEWLTGGSFGPEAGVLCLLSLGVGAWLVIAWIRRTRGDARIQESIAAYAAPAKPAAMPPAPAGPAASPDNPDTLMIP